MVCLVSSCEKYVSQDEAKWYTYASGILTGKQSRPKISSQIDGVSRFPSERRSNTEDEEKKAERCQVPGADVAVVFEGEDAEDQDRAGDYFTEEHPCSRHEGLGVGAEDAGCGRF